MNKSFAALFCFLTLLSGCSALPPFDYEPVKFTVSGETAVMTGVIDSGTQATLKSMLDQNPQVTTLVMQNVEGSVDDEANLIISRYVRKRDLNTHIPNDGLVASGGTDFFLSGVKRTASPYARIGVHSWSGGNVEAIKLPKDHPEHSKYLDYYRVMGIPEEFYWFTLEAAPSDDIHWMSLDEQRLYKLISK